MTQKEYKKQLIKLIQINKSNVFFDDDERKDFIKSRFGVDSTTKLSIDQLKLLLDFCLRKVGDIPLYRYEKSVTEKQKEKIRCIWKEIARDKSEAALLNFASKISQYKLIVLDNLTGGEATKVIVALEKMK